MTDVTYVYPDEIIPDFSPTLPSHKKDALKSSFKSVKTTSITTLLYPHHSPQFNVPSVILWEKQLVTRNLLLNSENLKTCLNKKSFKLYATGMAIFVPKR